MAQHRVLMPYDWYTANHPWAVLAADTAQLGSLVFDEAHSSATLLTFIDGADGSVTRIAGSGLRFAGPRLHGHSGARAG